MFNVYLGWDDREIENLNVCEYSINKHCKHKNLEIKYLVQRELREKELYWRPKDEQAATDFSLTRFLIPHLEHYAGYSIFIDSDNIITDDICKVVSFIDPKKAVSVVKHNYVPKSATKMDGQTQHSYPRKNWSSFIVFNNSHPSNKSLTPLIVNNSSPAYLHRFSWLKDSEIGELPLEFNFLVGEYEWISEKYLPFNLHYTLGSPIFPEYRTGPFSDTWIKYYAESKGVDIPSSPEHHTELAKKEWYEYLLKYLPGNFEYECRDNTL